MVTSSLVTLKPEITKQFLYSQNYYLRIHTLMIDLNKILSMNLNPLEIFSIKEVFWIKICHVSRGPELLPDHFNITLSDHRDHVMVGAGTSEVGNAGVMLTVCVNMVKERASTTIILKPCITLC